MALLNEFKHAPLDLSQRQIRLLEIQPSESCPGATLPICEINHYTFGECPPYKALSYRWNDNGDDELAYDLVINGHSFKILDNVHSFLCIINDGTTKRFWIDAICVDQSNVLERNHQVHLMDRIYNEAEEVVVWLGVAAEHSSFAMSLIFATTARDSCIPDTLGESYQYHSVQDSCLKPWWERDTENRSHPCIWGPRFMNAFLALCQREYWERVWVVQELMNAREIVILCGDKQVAWSDFFLTIKKLEAGRVPSHIIDPALVSAISQSHAKALFQQKADWGFGAMWRSHKRRLSFVLKFYEYCESSEPLDKVYGLLGLVRPSNAISVDYSNSREDVYFRVLKKVAEDEFDISEDGLIKFARMLRRSLGLPVQVDVEAEEFITFWAMATRTCRAPFVSAFPTIYL
jgi:hypothetical protein